MPEITIKDLRQRHIEAFLRARREIRNGWNDIGADELATTLVGFATELGKAKLEADKYRAVIQEFVQGLAKREERRGEISAAEEDGIRVRAAARCEWFDDLDEDDVPDLKAWEVDQLSDQIAGEVNAAYEVPKN